MLDSRPSVKCVAIFIILESFRKIVRTFRDMQKPIRSLLGDNSQILQRNACTTMHDKHDDSERYGGVNGILSSLLRADVQRLPRRRESVPHACGGRSDGRGQRRRQRRKAWTKDAFNNSKGRFSLIRCRLTRKRVASLEGVKSRFLHSADDPCVGEPQTFTHSLRKLNECNSVGGFLSP